MSEDQSQVLAELVGADLQGRWSISPPAISDLRAPFASPPQEVLDVSAKGDIAEIPDPEAETYSNVGVFTSLPDLKWEPMLMSGLPLA